SHPNVPALVFADHKLPGSSVNFHGGPIGTGLPVQLIYWGSWWQTKEGSARRTLIDSRTQSLLASDYFSELAQYGIARPSWRGSLICTEPPPPAAFNKDEDQEAVPDLIDDLIDADVFPDPDEGRIAFVVLMPEGFATSIADGAHTSDFDQDFLDRDYYWVAWVRFFNDPELTMRTLSHELVEMFTDPEGDGWYCQRAEVGEIADAAVSGSIKQAAWVNDVRVQAYWSNNHSATVIPVDRDYRARISGTLAVDSATTLTSGTFRPSAAQMALCSIVPDCCFSDRDYSYEVVGRDESITLRLETQRYRAPRAAWTLAGQPISGNGNLKVHVTAETYVGRDAQYGDREVSISYTCSDADLRLGTAATSANFDVQVGCAVTDVSINGNVRVNVIAKPQVTIGFVGIELKEDSTYQDQLKACNKAAHRMFDRTVGGAWRRPRPGEPLELPPGVVAELPAYTRVARYQALRATAVLSRAASRALPEVEATAAHTALVSRAPLLRAAAHAVSRPIG
ncbi:hypothetical protein, partial [Micromonospora sp. NPDC051296]|uniref:hypothetical protein n=1 Tax=Micromonospora sp. NPDC051296 TaxID=3155046 RepID=UPI003431CCCE